MPSMTKYSNFKTSSQGNLFSNIWDWFFALDKLTRMYVITGILIMIAVPSIVAEQTGFFTHAGSSVFTTCVEPPAGFSQQELDMMSQSRKVNWCRTLAQNITQQTLQNTADSTDTQSLGGTIFSPLSNALSRLFQSIRKLLLGY